MRAKAFDLRAGRGGIRRAPRPARRRDRAELLVARRRAATLDAMTGP
jgi:hypothetical protein